MIEKNETLETVKKYYGQILKTNQDLKTSACCPAEGFSSYLSNIIKEIHPEVLERFYGCGSPIPTALEGQTVLDLGCGTGRDCFILSKLVGSSGQVLGVDMTPEQLAVARQYTPYHMERFGFTDPNIVFHEGLIEDLESLGIDNGSIDVVVSNCVLNLSPAKSRVFREIFRVLKPGGELYFSDVFASRRLPRHLAEDPILIGECLGGALYIQDFRRLLAGLGCPDYRIMDQRRLQIDDPQIARQVEPTEFYSMTIRAFKLELEDRCEDYGQKVTYRGTIPECSQTFLLDNHHHFDKGESVAICGNTAAMLAQTRYQTHFRVTGDRSIHYGLFDCGPAAEGPEVPTACC